MAEPASKYPVGHCAGDGIIGAMAGYHVQRLSSNIYWNGLRTWGILLFPGPEAGYYERLDGYYERQRTNRVSPDGEPDKELLPDNWHPRTAVTTGWPVREGMKASHKKRENLKE